MTVCPYIVQYTPNTGLTLFAQQSQYNETSATVMKSKFAIRDEVLEFFYLENGIAWPTSDDGDREKATRRGETRKHTR